MKRMKSLLMVTLLFLGIGSTALFTACKDVCKNTNCQHGGSCSDGTCNCITGYSGNACQTEVRTTYIGTYKGNGNDNQGNALNNYSLVFNSAGTGVTSMTLMVLDASGSTRWSFDITLTSNTTYQIVQKTDGTDTYTGNGNIGVSTSSLTLTRKPLVGDAVTYTFSIMTRQ